MKRTHTLSKLRLPLVAAMLLGLTACSSGGDSNTIAGDDTGNNPNPPAPSANQAPTISGLPQGSVKADEAFSFTPSASDPDGDSLTFSIENRPSWVDSFDQATGRIDGTPSAADVGMYENIVITVSDGALSDSLSPFSVEVTQVALGATTLSWTPPTQNTDGSPLTDLAGYAFYYGTSSGSYPNRIQIDNPGISSYVVEDLTPDRYYFVAVAIKSNGLESNYSNEAIKDVL